MCRSARSPTTWSPASATRTHTTLRPVAPICSASTARSTRQRSQGALNRCKGPQAAIASLRGRPLRTACARPPSHARRSPPHTPHGSARSSAAVKLGPDRTVGGAQHLGPLQITGVVGEPQVRDLRHGTAAPAVSGRTCPTPFLVSWRSVSWGPGRLRCFGAETLRPRIRLTRVRGLGFSCRAVFG